MQSKIASRRVARATAERATTALRSPPTLELDDRFSMGHRLNPANIAAVGAAAATTANPFPRRALIALGTLLLVTVLGAATVRMAGVDIRTPDAAAAFTRELRFEDRPDGSVAVVDARSVSE